MAYIATVKILVDEADNASVFDGINETLRDAQMGGPNQAENAYPGCKVLGTEGGDHE
jgi:hypothetical protein